MYLKTIIEYPLILIFSLSLLSCGNKHPMQDAIAAETTRIMTKELSTTGKMIQPVEINDIEIDQISPKDYYDQELKQQDAQFSNFMESVKKMKSPISLGESITTHERVMSYLTNARDTASTKPGVYKVTFQLKAATPTAKYDHPHVLFLDSTLKKIEPDYRFLKEN